MFGKIQLILMMKTSISNNRISGLNYIMDATRKNPSFNEIDAAIKNLNITSRNKNKNESITYDELFLFKPNILEAIDYVREKWKRPDTIAIHEYLVKPKVSNIDKKATGNIILELTNQKILQNKKSAHGFFFV